MMRKLRKFTPEQVRTLLANPYTSRVDSRCIWYTDEFMQLFLERYKNGDSSLEIFSSCGYDTAVLGVSRVHSFPCRVRRLLGVSQLTRGTKKVRASGLVNMNHDAVPVQQTIYGRCWKL